MRGAFLGRGGGFYFVRLENKNPYLGEPRWTTSGWPASRFMFDTSSKPFYIFNNFLSTNGSTF